MYELLPYLKSQKKQLEKQLQSTGSNRQNNIHIQFSQIDIQLIITQFMHRTQTQLLSYKIDVRYFQNGGFRSDYKRTYAPRRRTMRKKKRRNNTLKGGRVVSIKQPTLSDILEASSPKKTSIMILSKVHSNINKEKRNETIQEESDRLYELSYRVNRELPKIVMDNKLGACYFSWPDSLIPDKRLTRIFKTLIEKNIITEDELSLLIHRCYVYYSVYNIDTELHRRKLNEELGRFGFTKEKIEAIRQVYRTCK